MIRRASAILLLLVLGIQLLSLPVTYAWFYANQADIAARHCVNNNEPLLMCSGTCYLNELVVAQLPIVSEQDPAPATERSERGQLLPFHLDLPQVSEALPSRPPCPTALDPAANFAYRFSVGLAAARPVVPPPKVC